MVNTFRALLPGYGLQDGDDVNIIIDAVNAAVVTAGLNLKPIGRLEPGYRMINATKLQDINAAIIALGDSSPVKSIAGIEPGYRLHTGMLVSSLAATVGIVAGTPAGGGSVVPTVTTAPSLSTSSPKVGTAVTPTPGVYTGSPTVTAQWFYGDTGGLVPGAPTTSGTAYTPVSADFGHTLKYIETATNAGGSVAGAAPTTGAVAAAAAATVSAKSTLSSSLGFIAPFLGAY